MRQVAGLPNNSNKPITNTAWVRAQLCKLQKRVHSTDKVYQLLAHGRWFSPGTLASSTSKTGRHDIAEILLKVALNTKNHHHRHGSVQQHISFFQSNFNGVFFSSKFLTKFILSNRFNLVIEDLYSTIIISNKSGADEAPVDFFFWRLLIVKNLFHINHFNSFTLLVYCQNHM